MVIINFVCENLLKQSFLPGRRKTGNGWGTTKNGRRASKDAQRTGKTHKRRTEKDPWKEQLETEVEFYFETSDVSLLIRFSCNLWYSSALAGSFTVTSRKASRTIILYPRVLDCNFVLILNLRQFFPLFFVTNGLKNCLQKV